MAGAPAARCLGTGVWAPADGDAERQGTSGMELIDAAHPRYDEYRALFNAMTDKRPGLIARCGTPGDVAAILQRARAARPRGRGPGGRSLGGGPVGK